MYNIMWVTLGLHTAPMADTAAGCKSNFALENMIEKTLPKAAICLGVMGVRLRPSPLPIFRY